MVGVKGCVWSEVCFFFIGRVLFWVVFFRYIRFFECRLGFWFFV